ncbi:hypothetical protein [Aeromonas molluscorum]|uniref:hypothetical protein n=1 Tax=Aeromonas molluscorum TaxID=271417 RepID=UPI003F1A498F
MAKQLVTDIVINLAGNLATKSRQYSQSMSQFAANNQRAMNMLKMSTAAAGRGIDAIGSRYVALGAAVAGGATVKGYAELDRRISRIAIAADISRDKAKELKEEINAVSNTKGLRIDPSEATAAVEEILTKTGDLEYAIANLPNIAAVIQATGAGGTEVGGIFTEFKKLAIDSSEAAMRAIDTLNLQGKQGAFTLGNMAKEGPKIFAAYAATGRQGASAVTELGAALQVIRQGVGSDAEAVTAFESVIRDLTRPETVKKLKQLGGIEVFEPEQLKEGKEVMRSLPVLIEEIVKKSKGLSSNLAGLNLTDEAKRALKPVIAEFVQTSDVKAFDEFLTLSGDGTTTLNDAAVAASDFAASLQLVSNSWSQFANQQLAEPIAELADAINSLEPDAVQNWLETGKNIALVVGGLVAVKKGIDAVKWTKGVWDAAKPGKGGAGGMDGAMADLGATPVYVVNMPGSGFGGGMGPGDMPGTEPGKGGKGSKPSRFSPAGLVQFGTVAAGISMIPDFSPINISRANGMSVNGIPQAPGILDVFDEMKAFFTRDISASPRPDNLSGTLDINVRDDRITVRTRDTAPGLQVRVDNGPSLMP